MSTEYNYWTLYYRSLVSPPRNAGLAMCLRSTFSTGDISQTVLRKMLNEMAQQGLIKNELPLYREEDKGYWEGWELCIAFDLCPCIELTRKTYHHRVIEYMVKDKWEWERIEL